MAGLRLSPRELQNSRLAKLSKLVQTTLADTMFVLMSCGEMRHGRVIGCWFWAYGHSVIVARVTSPSETTRALISILRKIVVDGVLPCSEPTSDVSNEPFSAIVEAQFFHLLDGHLGIVT